MKSLKILTKISYGLVLSVPFVLAGCEGMGNNFGNTNYDSYNKTPATTVSPNNQGAAVNHKNKTSGTTMVQPGATTVITPKTTTTTTNGVPLDGPIVPSQAPTVGQ